jgi:hypothetical protein
VAREYLTDPASCLIPKDSYLWKTLDHGFGWRQLQLSCGGSDEKAAKDRLGRIDEGGGYMLNMVSGLARTLYIVLAIVAGFGALGTMDVALVLVVLGLIAGLTLPQDRYITAAVTVIALPFLGAALGHIPSIGAQLNAICGNLQLGMAGAVVTAMAMRLYTLGIEGVPGMSGMAGGKRATA